MRPTHFKKSAILAVSLAFTSGLAARSAQAGPPALADASGSGWSIQDGGSHSRPHQFDIQLGLLWDGYFGAGLGVGAWYAIPVAPDGFIPRVNDSFDIEFGAIFGLQPSVTYPNNSYSGVGLNLIPAVGVRWNFFLTPDWSIFASLKLAWDVYLLSGYRGGIAVPVTAGALFKLSNSLHLRLEAGYPFGLSAGLTFDI